MITIQYSDNVKGEPVVFELLFPINEYVPNKYFENSSEGNLISITLENDTKVLVSPELVFFLDLFEQYKLLNNKIGQLYIWSIHFECNFNGSKFSMLYDEDYKLISFVVSDSSKRIELSEYICKLIERIKRIN